MAKLDLRSTGLSMEQFRLVADRFPSAKIAFSFTMFGEKVTTDEQQLNLNGKELGSADAVAGYLQYLPNLTRVEIDGTDLADEELGTLQQRFPGVVFVWTIHFATYTMQTDITAFRRFCTATTSSATPARRSKSSNTARNLRRSIWATAKSSICRSSAGLTKMRILILACNRIQEISALQNMNDLEYLELFSNSIDDYSPLAGKARLLDANLNCNMIKSIEPLLTCTGLERLWVGNCGLSSTEVKKLREGLPNCKVNTSSGNAPTTAGWRTHARYFVMKEVFRTRVYQPF